MKVRLQRIYNHHMIIVHLFKSKRLHNDTEVLPPVITFVMQLIWFYPPKGHKSRSNHYNKSDLFNLKLFAMNRKHRH